MPLTRADLPKIHEALQRWRLAVADRSPTGRNRDGTEVLRSALVREAAEAVRQLLTPSNPDYGGEYNADIDKAALGDKAIGCLETLWQEIRNPFCCKLPEDRGRIIRFIDEISRNLGIRKTHKPNRKYVKVKQAILEALRLDRPLKACEIANTTGYTEGYVRKALAELEGQGVIRRAAKGYTLPKPSK